jgi:exodeoxyribonuclease VII small subunit
MPEINDEELNELISLTTEDIEKLTYEDSMNLLERIVDALEQEGTPLESATRLYEIGNTLSKRCGSILDSTEEKMVKLLNEAEEVKEEDFDPEKDGR